jgi:hypothetical protein
MEQSYAAAGIEPPLEELLDDHIAQLLMRRDGIGPADVWRSVEAARARLAHAGADPAARGGGDAAAERSQALGTDSRVGPPAGSGGAALRDSA